MSTIYVIISSIISTLLNQIDVSLNFLNTGSL